MSMFFGKSIKGILVWTSLILIAIPVIGIGVVARWSIEGKLEKELSRENAMLARSLGLQVDQILKEAEHLVHMIGLSLSTVLEDSNSVHLFLANVTASNRNFSLIQVLDEKGFVRYSSRPDGGQIGYDLSRHPTYTRALSSGAFFWSPSFIPLKGREPTVSISKRFGSWIVAGYLDLSRLSRTVEVVAGHIGLRVAVTDREGTVVAASEGFAPSYRVNIRSHGYVREALEGSPGTYRLSDARDVDSIISVASAATADMLVIVYRDAEQVLQPVVFVQRLFAVLMVASAGLSLAVSFSALRRILGPFCTLSATTGRVAKGNYDVSLESSGFSELRDFENNFVLMAEAVRVREAALREAISAAEAANGAKSAFLANMSHELRTPLNAIIGFSQVLEKNAGLEGAQGKQLEIIAASGAHLLKMIDRILDLSRIEAGRVSLREENCDLKRLLEGVVEMARLSAEQKGLEVLLRWDPATPVHVLADPLRLRQVLINLLNNAVKFTRKGTVTLGVAPVDRSQGGTVEGAMGGKRDLLARFHVRDTGPGIAPDELPGIFDPFAQSETGRESGEGAGLGLAICRELVSLMGGEIRVKSKVGSGTVFSFELPLKPVDIAMVRVDSDGALENQRRRVEDSPCCRRGESCEDEEMAGLIRELSPSLVRKLANELREANMTGINREIAGIRKESSRLKERLQRLADEFEYEEILRLIRVSDALEAQGSESEGGHGSTG